MKLFLFLGTVAALMTVQLDPEWLAQQQQKNNTKIITPEVMETFKLFANRFNKTYGSDEEWASRLVVFAQNMLIADRDFLEDQAAGGSAVFGVTKFSDLTPGEFQSLMLSRPNPVDADTPVADEVIQETAESVDWRTKNMVTKVKDQGQCGSCWAFSTVEAIESYAALSGKYSLLDLSPQQIVSCDKPTDAGCNGGDTITAYKYVIKAGGLESESAYPYTSGDGKSGKCKFEKSGIKVKITGHKRLAKTEAALKQGLNNGPVSICVATGKWQNYQSGVLAKCPGQIDHCVQAVGYDDTASKPYWLVRNSWAADWGEEGYIRLEQGKDLCKIASEITYPTF